MASNNPTFFEILAKIVIGIIRFIAGRAAKQKEKAAQKLVAWQDHYTARRNARIQKLEMMKDAEKLAEKK